MIIKKRTAVVFAVLIMGFFVVIISLFTTSDGSVLAQAAARQSTYQLVVARSRGEIYDCNVQKITGRSEKTVAAVAPSIEAASVLNKVLPSASRRAIAGNLSARTPFLTPVSQNMKSMTDIDVFKVESRYEDHQSAANILGYLDGRGNGVTGIEKAYNELLSKNSGALIVSYQVDAANRVLSSEHRTIKDTRKKRLDGVELTIDRRIQKIAEHACKDKLKKGAVVITDVHTGEIKALVSLPQLLPNRIGESMRDPDSPLINRALSAYSVGSVFKIVSASAALEYGIKTSETYVCHGGIDVDGQIFHCFNGIHHGKVDMRKAIEKSCNGYFVQLMQKVPPEYFLAMARKLGFGKTDQLAPGLVSDAGVLPKEKELLVKKALANFSFGQGDLSATPLQISAMVGAVANGGVYHKPSLVKGIVGKDGKTVQLIQMDKGKRAMSVKTAMKLQQFMQGVVENGTGRRGAPEWVEAGAKTGTAQTGRKTKKGEIVQSWYAGFLPYNAPKYSVTVLKAESVGNGHECAEVFQKIADSLAELENFED